jgi:hypothetical protein
MTTTAKEELHRLVEALPDNALGAAEAFLAFLHDRAVTDEPRHKSSPNYTQEQNWAAGERRGLQERRQERDTIGLTPDPGDLA